MKTKKIKRRTKSKLPVVYYRKYVEPVEKKENSKLKEDLQKLNEKMKSYLSYNSSINFNRTKYTQQDHNSYDLLKDYLFETIRTTTMYPEIRELAIQLERKVLGYPSAGYKLARFYKELKEERDKILKDKRHSEKSLDGLLKEIKVEGRYIGYIEGLVINPFL